MIAKNFRHFLKNSQCAKYLFSSKQRMRDQFEELNKINEFDQQIKDKYLNKQYLDENFRNMDVNEVKARIAEEYEAEADKLLSEDSILNDIRSDMFENPEMKAQKKKLSELQEERQMQPLEKYFSNIDDHEFLKRARELQLDIDFHRLPDPEKRSTSISRDYANYSSYEKNNAQFKDLNNEWEEYPGEVYQGKRIMKFIQNLDSDITQKKQLNEQIKQLKTFNNDLTDEEIIKAHFDNEADHINKMKNKKSEFDLGDNEFEDDEGLLKDSERLSPQAREEIFRLYIQGWSVRDLSSRYGILPERVKAVIWLRQKFYFEVLPNVDIHCLKYGMELEQEYNQEFAYVDYGIDLEELSRRNTGIITPSFKKTKDVDVRALQFTEQKKEKIIDEVKRKGPKNAFVTSNFIGSNEKGYYYKDWVVNRGRGSDKVNKTFKKIVEMSKNPERLPKKIQKKLKQGPRIASQGFGHL